MVRPPPLPPLKGIERAKESRYEEGERGKTAALLLPPCREARGRSGGEKLRG